MKGAVIGIVVAVCTVDARAAKVDHILAVDHRVYVLEADVARILVQIIQ